MSNLNGANKSGLRPLGSAVLVKPYTKERKVGAILLLGKSDTLEQRAIIVEAGPEAWKDERQPRAQPGDLVLISALAGYAAMGPADDQPYRMVNARDVFAQITSEKETEND